MTPEYHEVEVLAGDVLFTCSYCHCVVHDTEEHDKWHASLMNPDTESESLDSITRSSTKR